MKTVIAILLLGIIASHAETTTITGSVFVVMKNGDNVKLALAPIHIMTEESFLALRTELNPSIQKTIRPMALKYIAAKKEGDTSEQLKIRNASEVFIQDYYFDKFPEAVTKSDADGKFTFNIQDSRPVIIACKSKRDLVEKVERYYWIEKFQPNGTNTTILLSNDNMLEDSDLLMTDSLLYQVADIEMAAYKKAKEESALRAEQNRIAQLDRTTKAKQRALEVNIEKAEKGDAYGQYRMGERYRDGDGVPKDTAKAKEFFGKAAAQGHAEAKSAMARLE